MVALAGVAALSLPVAHVVTTLMAVLDVRAFPNHITTSGDALVLGNVPIFPEVHNPCISPIEVNKEGV